MPLNRGAPKPTTSNPVPAAAARSSPSPHPSHPPAPPGVNLLAKWEAKTEHAEKLSAAGPPLDQYTVVTELEEDIYSLLLIALVHGANSPHIKTTENHLFQKHMASILLASCCTALFTLVISMSILAEFMYAAPTVEDNSHCSPLSLFSRAVALVLLMFMIGKEVMDMATYTQMLLLSKGKGMIDRTDGPFDVTIAPDSGSAQSKRAFSLALLVHVLRALSAIFVTISSVAVVHFADNGIEVFKDCVVFVFITEVDSLIFSAAKKGLLGTRLLKASNALRVGVGINCKIGFWTTYVRYTVVATAGVGVAIMLYTSCIA